MGQVNIPTGILHADDLVKCESYVGVQCSFKLADVYWCSMALWLSLNSKIGGTLSRTVVKEIMGGVD